ncbi:GntR family transcriptional regulator [Protofrankia symbiont of Coriaria ruscifolia]|uniref:GntR family transcriptional regulator n=1 Tax=Protofrankia symbiont of Coriaria ruscifolia TaxID=1306542 RepID=UPI001041A9F9|nr:GntR family transcriptional regulator [Protofrankia symbiont of Coriaria ruscifolia]
MIDRGRGRHAYQAIAEDIRGAITRGELRSGDKTPGLREIREQYNVANATAQAALQLLKLWGLVEGRPGAGTFVRIRRPVINVMDSMTVPGPDGTRRTWKEIAAEHGLLGTQQATGAGAEAVPIEVADAFGIDAGTIVTWRRRLLLLDGQPVQIATSYYPPHVAEAVPELGRPERLPMMAPALLARAGWSITSSQDRVLARHPLTDEAETLGLTSADPVVETLRTCRTGGGEVVDVTVMVTDGARMHMVYVFGDIHH